MERREKFDGRPPVCDLCGEAIERPGEVVVRRGIASHACCASRKVRLEMTHDPRA